MSNIFLTSDQHFNHANILTFKDKHDMLIRPEFSSVEEMNEVLIEKYNSVVKPSDKTYFLGDVYFGNAKGFDAIMSRLNGTKVLIKGNHDKLKPLTYLQYFKDIRACHQLDRFLLTHIPVHGDSLGRWKANVHGHIHEKTMGFSDYYNVSVEVTNYTPVALETIQNYYR